MVQHSWLLNFANSRGKSLGLQVECPAMETRWFKCSGKKKEGGMPVREHTQSILKVCHCVKIIIGKIYGKGVKLLLRKVLLDDERN